MPRCKSCKEKFEPLHFNQKYCFTPACVGAWVESVAKDKWNKQKKEFRQKESEGLAALKTKAKYHFHKWIRERDKLLGCISCQKPLSNKYDAGHFFNSNNHASVRFNEHNVNAQCVYCNQHLHGNLIEYQIHLKEKIGISNYETLEGIRHEHKTYTAEDYKDIILRYKH